MGGGGTPTLNVWLAIAAIAASRQYRLPQLFQLPTRVVFGAGFGGHQGSTSCVLGLVVPGVWNHYV